MGPEPAESSPSPEPELTHSPEPEIPCHDNRNWKADMMSALGESVSFGRYLTEPLEWGKWSAFAHNRYLEEAAVQARPGSVAQKKAFFEAHYARKKRKSEDHGAAADDADGGLEEAAEEEDGGTGTASWPSSPAESSCMTDQAPAPGDQEMCGDGETGVVTCGGCGASDELVEVTEELAAVTNAVGPSCRMDEHVDELRHAENGNEQVAGPVLASLEKKDVCSSNLVAVDAIEKESSIINQDITDSAKKRRIQMSSLFQKPTRFRSPPSGKKGQSSSVKRRSPLHSAKENTSPPGTEDNMQGLTFVPQKRSTLTALHMHKSFTRCEMGNAASGSRNLGTTIAERISQLESASRPVETTRLEEFGPPRNTFSTVLPETAQGKSQVDEQRSSHIMRIKEKLFGSTSPSVHQKNSVTKGKEVGTHQMFIVLQIEV
ncbi:hypothetical protein HU200_058408 [Digitaria exilis]|uniref:Protein WVD2-like 7 n=1 Tax=Digitaria exilis TaxID=1010633 RepID=A0A835AIB0_9POAL|nr:hypothetical protein HU200_058408 [Digitaria exilis]